MMRMRRSVGAYAGIIAAVVAAAVLVIAAAVFAFGAGADDGGRRTVDVEPRAGLSDYSWTELSAIAAEISACSDEADAIAVAARYGLCAEDGSLGDLSDESKMKQIVLGDGRTVHVQLAGIWHDERADGGKAGLTFVFANAVGEHAMNHAFEDAEGENPDSTGGWAACDMRTWLNGDFYRSLPDEVRSCIVPVQKRTASRIGANAELDEAGRLVGGRADWIDETTDSLWLFSASEICGDVPTNDLLGVDSTMAAVYAGEGTQYRLFADWDVKAFEPNATLMRTSGTWWLRTKTLEFGDGFWLVGTDGTPLNGYGEDARVVQDPEFAPDALWGPDHARGVVAGFCL